jgi:hypothetical protein
VGITARSGELPALTFFRGKLALAFAALASVHQHGGESLLYPPRYILRISRSGQNHRIARCCQKTDRKRIPCSAEDNLAFNGDQFVQVHNSIVGPEAEFREPSLLREQAIFWSGIRFAPKPKLLAVLWSKQKPINSVIYGNRKTRKGKACILPERKCSDKRYCF